MRIDLESPPALSEAERAAAVAKALRDLDRAWMLEQLTEAVNIPSPTGEERAFAEHLVGVMEGCGLSARLQTIDAYSANAIAEVGAGRGPSVMLFAPLDSPFSGNAAEEVPWIGPALRPDHIARAQVHPDGVTGLSADNPKGHIVAAIAAARAIRATGCPLEGRVVLAFAAGGAPAHHRPSLDRANVGLGAGCEFLLKQGVRTDFAIITKPGFAVQWEEVGVCWFRVRVHGAQSYVGRKHVLAEDNPILSAARIALELERWFGDYARAHTDGLVAPQGAIGAIEGGWTYKPAFTPAACDLYVDMRISPRTRPMEAWRELCDALASICRGFGERIPRVDCDMIAAVDGPATASDNWIIRCCTSAWEAVEGRPHQALRQTSGQTEAVILRRHGIPTARVGLPAQMSPGAERPLHSMGITRIDGVARLAELLVRALIDTCTRSLAEVGLGGGEAKLDVGKSPPA